MDELKAREELLQEELATAKAIEAVKLDRDRVLFLLESMAEIDDPKALIDVFVSKVVLTGDDDLHIFHYFDDNGGALSPGDDGGGGVLPNVNMLHHRNISRTPWLGYYVAWRTLVIVARYKKTP